MKPAPYDYYGGFSLEDRNYQLTESPYISFKREGDDSFGNRGKLRGTFSFADIDARLILPFVAKQGIYSPQIPLPGLTFISISSHGDVYPVVAMGSKRIKGFTTGHCTYGGSLGFIVHGEHAFSEAVARYTAWAKGEWGDFGYVSPQQLPPLDLSVTMVNSDGQASILYIKSFKLIDMAKAMGVDDIQIRETYSFICASIRNQTLFFDNQPEYVRLGENSGTWVPK
jgi:hypothetical protein